MWYDYYYCYLSRTTEAITQSVFVEPYTNAMLKNMIKMADWNLNAKIKNRATFGGGRSVGRRSFKDNIVLPSRGRATGSTELFDNAQLNKIRIVCSRVRPRILCSKNKTIAVIVIARTILHADNARNNDDNIARSAYRYANVVVLKLLYVST